MDDPDEIVSIKIDKRTIPKGVISRAQYGNSIKTQAVYLSQQQLIPYAQEQEQEQEHFTDQLLIPLSAETIHIFNRKAFDKLEEFDRWVKHQLTHSALLLVDETGININGKRHWLHCTSNLEYTYYYPHERRGTEAMDEIDILPQCIGALCHDHWKPYYTYLFCIHSLQCTPSA